MKRSFGTKSWCCWSHWKWKMQRTSAEVLSTFEDWASLSRELGRCIWDLPAEEVIAWQDENATIWRTVLDGTSSCSDCSFPSFFQVCLLSWPALVSVGTLPWAPHSGWLQRLDSCLKTFCHWYSRCCILHFCTFFVCLLDHWSFLQMT